MIDKQFEKEEFKKSVKENVKFLYRKTLEEATQEQIFQAVSYTVKDVIIDNWLKSQKAYEKQDPKIVYYMSMEFLMGRALGNNLLNLGAYGEVKEALEELGIDINALEDQEPDPALGNGGLGRLAACFLDSLATLGYSAYGCGIRYRYGMFKQEIRDGYQVEVPDAWLEEGYPFELRRPEYAKEVHFGGYVRVEYDQATGQNKFVHEGYQAVKAIPYDMPIVGYENNVVNTLRIWDAAAIEEFGFDSFDKGDYKKAVEQENLAKDIVNVLYPNDNKMSGKELRLKQQYFFVSASLQAAIAKYKKTHDDITKLHEKVVFQMNDTHPTVAVAELMRILIDEEGLGWDQAWDITTKCCAYTNHTIMSEALEKWPVSYLEEVVPHLMPIIRKLDERIKAKYPQENLAIIDKNDLVHMAHMDIHYGFSINGVASLHTDILKETELHQFYEIYPEKFNNKTNGITFRRWLLHCNHPLTEYITSMIGDGFRKDSFELDKMLGFKGNQDVLANILKIKQDAKKRCAEFIKANTGEEINTHSVYDIQIKRLHEYKRQQLNALYIIDRYLKIKAGEKPQRPVTFIFGAKAAPAYVIAKDIIHLLLCFSADTLHISSKKCIHASDADHHNRRLFLTAVADLLYCLWDFLQMTASNNIRLIHQQIIKTVLIGPHRTKHRGIAATASRRHDQHNRIRNRQTCTFDTKSFCSRRIECQRCRGTVDQMCMGNKLSGNVIFSKLIQLFYRTKICFLSHAFSSSFHNNVARSKKHLLISEAGSPSITVFPCSSQ